MGCRGDGLDRRYPVSGVVTYKGQAVESGTISFHPKDAAGRVAAGTIVAGAYHLTTLTPSDGAFPGIYDVTVVAKRVDRLARPPFVGGQVSQEEIARATKAARNDVPEKYQRAPSSGLTREVRPRRNRFDFDLVD